MLQRISTDFPSGFSEAVVVPVGGSRMIYVSGTVGNHGAAAVSVTSFDEEVRIAFANIARSLAKCGVTMKEVVRLVAYITDLTLYPTYAAVRAEVFAGNLPASSTVGVASLLANSRIEIDVIAVG